MKIKRATIKPATLPEILRAHRITPQQVESALQIYGYGHGAHAKKRAGKATATSRRFGKKTNSK